MSAEAAEARRTRLRWSRSVRIVADGRDPIAIFESISDPGELDAVLAVRAFTDTHSRDLLARLERIDPRDRLAGPGSSDATTPFLFYPPEGSRFTDGSFGLYYAARDRPTAIAETIFHRERWLAWTRQGSTEVLMRVLHGAHGVNVVDVRGERTIRPELYARDPDGYAPAQRFGASVRAAGRHGIAYDSVRHAGGQCVALCHPRAVGPVERSERLGYVWSGPERKVVEVREIRPIPLPGGSS